MKKLQNKKGFTLIELLVVITIIGILATGGISIFTKQLQGARDTTRINNLKILETANNQYNSDNSEYPTDASSWAYQAAVVGYMSKYPEDPKSGQNICWTSTAGSAGWQCGIFYDVGNDSNGLANGAFKLSLPLEKQENASGSSSPAAKDGWNITWYLEAFGGAGWAAFGTGIKLY